MSLDYENDGELHGKLIEEVLAQYPDKFAKRRKKHLSVASDAGTEEIEGAERPVTECDVKSNIKSIPGVMTVVAAPMPDRRAWCGVRSRTWSTSPTARSAAASIPGPSAATTTSARPASTLS